MYSSASSSSYIPFWLAADRAAISSDTEALFRTNHSISQAYQTVMTTAHNYLTSRFIDDNDNFNHTPNNESAVIQQYMLIYAPPVPPPAGQLSTDDVCARARTAWSRAYRQNNPEPRYNRPNISGALSIPPMPHIITDYTTSLPRQEYYIFLEKCWSILEKGTTSNQLSDLDLPKEGVPPPITAYSFDLLGFGYFPLQPTVLAVNGEASVDNDVSVTDEIPVDQSTLDRLVGLIDELLEDDGASTISGRFLNVALVEDGSALEDSDKENSEPLFFPSYESDECYEESDNSSELEGSDKENMRPLSPLLAFTERYPPYETSLNGSDDESESPLDSVKENARPLSSLYRISGTPSVSLDSDDELDNSDKGNREALETGVLSTLFYDPYVEFAQCHVSNASLVASDDENDSELEDSDKENTPVLLCLLTPDNAGHEQYGPTDNALMLMIDGGGSASSISNYEDSMPSDDETALIAGIFDDETEHNRDASVFSYNNSDDSYSEHWNYGRSLSPYSSFSADIEGLNNRWAELDDANHFGYNTDISANESDSGYSNSSDNYRYRLTEEPATETDMDGGRIVTIANQCHFIDSNQPHQYTMLRPIARLPRRLTPNGAKHQIEHLDGDAAGVGSKNDPDGKYLPKYITFSATGEGCNDSERYSSATDARTGAADPYDRNKTAEDDDFDLTDWTNERRIVFPISYERTRMNN